MEIFFTSDLHLGHKNIIKHCDRPFSSIEQMNRSLLTNINNIVGLNDDLYILGDFTAYGVNIIRANSKFFQWWEIDRLRLEQKWTKHLLMDKI